jgi:aryl carrier-like protein
MQTPEECIRKAVEAEQVAALVAYGLDRERMMAIAAMWREQARRADHPKRLTP